MIKIVGQDGSIARRVTCRNCGAILEYTPHDLKELQTKDITGSADITFCLKCPQCGYYVHIHK